MSKATTSTPATRVPADVGRYVNDARRERYFAACDALYAMGAPIDEELDVETSFGTTHVYRYGPAPSAPPAPRSCWSTERAAVPRCGTRTPPG